MGLTKRTAIICDLDNTLCNANHRVSWAKKRQWDKFFSLAHKDTINDWCLKMMLDFQSQGHEILFVTGRHTGLVQDTLLWMKTHTPFQVSLGHNLFMRGSHDRRKDDIVKLEIYKKYIEPNYKIILAVDDKPNVIAMWESLEIKTLHCGDGSLAD